MLDAVKLVLDRCQDGEQLDVGVDLPRLPCRFHVVGDLLTPLP
jgi:hypothetical protein